MILVARFLSCPVRARPLISVAIASFASLGLSSFAQAETSSVVAKNPPSLLTFTLPVNSRDERLGYVFSAQLGQLKKANDWQVAYYYAHIETLAVNASYSEDDWARFGNAFQSDCTDIKGHEFRGSYVIDKSFSITARVFLVEAITTRQDGKRYRIDLNWKF